MEYRRRGASGGAERDREQAIERRICEILERQGCHWVDALSQAVAEQDAKDALAAKEEDTVDVVTGASLPRRYQRDVIAPGRVTVTEKISSGLASRQRRGLAAFGRIARTTSLPPARRAMVMPNLRGPTIATAEQGPVVMRWADGAAPEDQAVEAALRPSGGEPLPPALRTEFERQFGCDLSAVRLHRDGAAHTAAQALHARAFTIGEHVFFLGGTPELDSRDGRTLLAHELTHVVQHYQGRVALRPGFAVSRPDDPLEREAETIGAAVARGGTAPARSLMGTSIATVGGDLPTPGPTSGDGDGKASGSSALSLMGFRAAEPASGDARTGKLQGSPPPVDALIGNVPPAAPKIGKPAAVAPQKPNRQAKPPVPPTPAAKIAGHAPATSTPPVGAKQQTPGSDGPHRAAAAQAAPAPQLHPLPTEADAAGAEPAQRVPEGPRASAADRAAARQAAEAAAQELAAHGAALAAQAHVGGQQVLAQIATDGDQQRQRVMTAAQTARQQVEQGIVAQRAAITARAAAEKTHTVAAAATQRTAIHAAAQAQRRHTTEQIAAERQAANAAAQQTKQGIMQAGEAQAQRAAAQTAARVTRARAIANGVGVSGDAERANAQRESATKISQRTVEAVQANGRELVQAAHETAAALASEVDDKLADYNHNLEQCAADTNQHIAKLENDATTELDTMARQAEQSISALATEAQGALDARQAAILASIEQSSSAATSRIAQSVAAIHAQAAPQIEQQCGRLAAAGREARVVFEGLQHADQVATAAAEARGQLAQAGAGIGQAIQGLHLSTRSELTSTGEAATASMTQAGARGAAEASSAGAALLEKIGMVATSATASINARGGKAQSTLVGSGQTLTQQLARAHGQFSDKLAGLVTLATRTISEKIDAGVAYQDQLVEKARGDARSAAQQIGARYDSLKSQADSRNASGAQRSWLSDAWNTVTGWIDSVRQWFLRTFGDFWGGLLFGILSAIVIVGIGLAIGWVVGAIVGAFIASSTVAAIVTAIILVVGAAAIAIYSRFQEFYADNPGQDAGFWRGLGLFGLGIADLTGLPYMIEGIVGQRAFGAKMNTAQSTERFGMGLVFLVTFGLATWKGVKWFRGRAPSAPPPVDPIDHPPVETVDPKTVDPKTVDPKTVDPKTVDPKTVDPKTVDPKTVDPKLPKSWDKFDPTNNDSFKARLKEFRGNNNLNPDFSGGEGRIFSAEGKLAALKRWFQTRLGDLPESLSKLERVKTDVASNPTLNTDVDVVEIHEKGPDWILRDFDPNSVELKAGPAEAQAARARAIAELEAMRSKGRLTDMLADLLKKLKKVPPSANLHWSPSKGKILVIDMQ